MSTKTCKQCGTTFTSSIKFKTYCSDFCKKENLRKRGRDYYHKTKDDLVQRSIECLCCSTLFNARNIHHKFCNYKCKIKYSLKIKSDKTRLNKRQKQCLFCSKDFIENIYNQSYCCKECRLEAVKKNKIKKNKVINPLTIERNKQHHIRYQTDLQYKLSFNLRNIIYQSLKRGCAKKQAKSIELLGCDIKSYKEYLESKFQKEMTWDNQGKGINKWQIDHIIPISSFDLTKEEEQKKCFHYTNTQPLWWKDNVSKGNKIIDSPVNLKKLLEDNN